MQVYMQVYIIEVQDILYVNTHCRLLQQIKSVRVTVVILTCAAWQSLTIFGQYKLLSTANTTLDG